MNNLSLTGSFIIGGLVLMTLMYVYFRFTSHQQDMSINQFTQTSIAGVSRVMDYDFDKIGYRVTSGTKITGIDTFSISFLADLDNNGVADSVCYFRSVDSAGTYMVRRTFETTVGQWQVAVSEFMIEGFDSANTKTYNAGDVRSIAVMVVLDNNKMATDTSSNIGSYWKKRFYPKNL